MNDKSNSGTEPDTRGTTPAGNSVSRLLWTVAGTLFLALGIIGIVVPLLPTTPFLLLAASCYLRGSPRMYRWMLTNKYFGTYLKNYREGKGIPLKVKIGSILVLWAVLGFSILVVTENWIVRIALIVIGVGVSVHLLTIRGEKSSPSGPASKEEAIGDLQAETSSAPHVEEDDERKAV